MTRLLLSLIRGYQRWLSPLLGARCRFYPSCSSYAHIAISRFGGIRGSWLAVLRILRCQPLCKGGVDEPPLQFRWWPPTPCRNGNPDNEQLVDPKR